MSRKHHLRFKLGVRNIAAYETLDDVHKVQLYLKRFGYLRSHYQPRLLDAPTQEALKTYQSRAGIKVSGVVDPETAYKIEEPRCGVIDFSDSERLVDLADLEDIQEPIFSDICRYEGVNLITYGIANKPDEMGEINTINAIRQAFNEWQRFIQVDFKKVDVSDNPVLLISWVTNCHGDGAPFDGIGNILAHAFPPPPCGDRFAGACHFDGGNRWSDAFSQNSFNVKQVALHEIGHLLGIGHLDNSDSIMNESFLNRRRMIMDEDAAILKAQLKYGSRVSR